MLMTLTLVSFALFEGQVLASFASFVIVAIAAFKARLVVQHFMEVAHAPGHWRFLYETWVFVAAAIIIIGHYVTLARIE
jgi:hypothetical protein